MGDIQTIGPCQKETFVPRAQGLGFLVDALPQVAEGQTQATGRCCTKDKDKRNVQYTFTTWAENEASWFFYDHRKKKGTLFTTAIPDRRSLKKWKAYKEVLQACEAERLRIEQEARERLKGQWDSCLEFEVGENVPYLERKGLRPTATFRRNGDNLVVPFYDADTGELVDIQTISPSGEKRGVEHGTTKDVYHFLPGIDEVPYVLVTEGARTGLACWDSSHASTFIAHNCGNIDSIAALARKRFPRHKIVLCADNDCKNEAVDGTNQGVEAARKAAQKHGCILAVPPCSDTDRNHDFADLYKEQGAEVVRATIELNQRDGDCTIPEGFEVDRKNGLVQRVPGKVEKIVKIGPYIAVEAKVIRTKDGAFGKRISWETPNGDINRAVLMSTSITSRDQAKLTALFSSYSVIPSKIGPLLDFLAGTKPGKLLELIPEHGWYGDVYAASANEVIGDPCHTAVPGFRSRPTDFEQRGSLAEWKEFVAEFTVGNPILTLMPCAGLTGTLHEMAGVESGGIHLLGFSSSGKTTNLKVGQSTWSSPKGMYSWRTSDNGLEYTAAAHSHALLTLDEFSQCPPKVASESVYMLSNGSGKVRAKYSDGQLGSAEPLKWNLSLLSSGEEDLEARVAEFGGRFKAGQDIRMPSIPVSSEDVRDCHGFASSLELVEHLNRNVERYFGTAGPEFVRHLIPNLPVLRRYLPSAVLTQAKYLCRRLPFCDGQVSRVAKRFALYWLTGVLAVRFGILPHTEQDIEDAVQECFDRWIEHRGGFTALEEEQYLNIFREHFTMHEANYIVNRAPDYQETINIKEAFPRCPNPLYGYIDHREGYEGVYLPVATFNRMIQDAGKDKKRAVEILRDQGYLPVERVKTTGDRRYQTNYTVYWANGIYLENGKRIWCYRIRFPEAPEMFEQTEVGATTVVVSEHATADVSAPEESRQTSVDVSTSEVSGQIAGAPWAVDLDEVPF